MSAPQEGLGPQVTTANNSGKFLDQRVTTLEQRRTEAMNALANKGIRLLTSSETMQMADTFQREIQRGIESNSQALDGLKMYRSHVPPNEGNIHLAPHTRALVVEVGGTNAYAAIVESNEQGKVEIATSHGIELVITSPLRERTAEGKRQYENAEDFFTEIVDKLKPLLQGQEISALGVVYSFPGSAKKRTYGVDVVSAPSESLAKDFDIPGIDKTITVIGGQPHEEERFIGQSLLTALHKEDTTISEEIPVIVANDTVAVASARLGGVIGTGFNLAVVADIDGEIQFLNMEAGDSKSVPETDLSRELVGGLNYPAERQISGITLGQYLDYSARYLAREGLLPQVMTTLGPEEISMLLDENGTDISKAFSQPLDQDQLGMLKQIATVVSERSAQIAGTLIGVTINTFPESFTEDNLFVPIEGSVMWKVPGYKENLKKYVEETAQDKTVDFGTEAPEHAGIKGVGGAVLTQLSNENRQTVESTGSRR